MRMTKGSYYTGLSAYPPDSPIKFSDHFKITIRKFMPQIHNKGIYVYFANTPQINNNTYNIERIKKSSSEFRRSLSNYAPIINNKEDFLFDRKYFVNSRLHLNDKERQLNTGRLKRVLINSLIQNNIASCNQ